MKLRIAVLLVALAACSSATPHQSRTGKVNVQLSEVPSGWAHPQRTAAGEKELLAQRDDVTSCVGSSDTPTSHEDSPRFASGAQSISSLVFTYSSPSALSSLVFALKGQNTQGCYKKVVEAGLVAEEAGTTIDSDVVQVEPGPSGSPLVMTVFGSITFTRPGGTPATTTFDLYDIAQGSHLVEVRFASNGDAVDHTLEQRIVAAVQARAVKAF